MGTLALADFQPITDWLAMPNDAVGIHAVNLRVYRSEFSATATTDRFTGHCELVERSEQHGLINAPMVSTLSGAATAPPDLNSNFPPQVCAVSILLEDPPQTSLTFYDTTGQSLGVNRFKFPHSFWFPEAGNGLAGSLWITYGTGEDVTPVYEIQLQTVTWDLLAAVPV